MPQLIAKYNFPTSRPIVWADLQRLGSAGWVNIGSRVQPAPGSGVTRSELTALGDPPITGVLAGSQSVTAIGSAVTALQEQGLGPNLEPQGVWTGGRLYYALIDLHTS